MRLASFYVENLFDRAKAMNLETWADGRAVLDRRAGVYRADRRPERHPTARPGAAEGEHAWDAFAHPDFDDGGFPGTFGLGNGGNKID